jgi:hypothetical protein
MLWLDIVGGGDKTWTTAATSRQCAALQQQQPLQVHSLAALRLPPDQAGTAEGVPAALEHDRIRDGIFHANGATRVECLRDRSIRILRELVRPGEFGLLSPYLVKGMTPAPVLSHPIVLLTGPAAVKRHLASCTAILWVGLATTGPIAFDAFKRYLGVEGEELMLRRRGASVFRLCRRIPMGISC